MTGIQKCIVIADLLQYKDTITLLDILELVGDQYHTLLTQQTSDTPVTGHDISHHSISFIISSSPVKDVSADCNIHSTQWIIQQVNISITIHCPVVTTYTVMSESMYHATKQK